MGKKKIVADCFLCGSPSTYDETDHSNCRYYNCEGAECGDFEISRRAMGHIETSPTRRAQLSAKAREAREKGQVLRIVIDSPSQQLSISIVGKDAVR